MKMGKSGGRLHELLVHGANGIFVLGKHIFHGAPPTYGIPSKATDQANICRCIYENHQIKAGAKAGIGKNEDSLDHEEGCGLHALGVGTAVVGAEEINGKIYGSSLAKLREMKNEEVGIEGIGMIEVETAGMMDVVVVAIMAQVEGIGLGNELAGDGGLAGGGSSGDADDVRLHEKTPEGAS